MRYSPYGGGSAVPFRLSAYPEQSQAMAALLLGMTSFVFVGILAPFAWLIGHRELAAIDAGRRSPDNRAAANAARILGIAGTVFLVIIATVFSLALVGVIEVT